MSKKKTLILSCLFLLFFFVPLAFYPWATSFSITKRTVAQILLLLVAIVWLLFLASNEERRSSFCSPISLPLLAFGAVVALSLIKLRPGEWYLGLTHLTRWYAYILAFFILVTALKERGLKFLVRIACIAGFFASIYLIVQFYGVDFWFWGDIGGRKGLFSTFGNPNFIAGYLIGIIPVVTGFYLGLNRKFMVVLLGAGIATMYTAVIMTRTRASWAGLLGAAVVGLALLYFFRRDLLEVRKTRIAILLIVLLAIAAVYSVPNPINVQQISATGRAASVTNLQQGSLQHRFLMWITAARMGAKSPVIGNGVGSFDACYPEARTGVLSQYEGFKSSAPDAYRPHNELLQLWAETGIIGVLAACWIVVAFFWMSYAFLSSNGGDKGEEKLSLIALTGGVVAILGHTVFSFPFHVTPNGLLFILLIASGWGVVRSSSIKVNWGWSGVLDSFRPKGFSIRGKSLGRGRWLIIGPLILACLFLIGFRVQIFRSDIYLKSGQLKMKGDRYDKAIKNLNRAKNLMPYYGEVDAALAKAYNGLNKPEKALMAAKEAAVANDQPGLMAEMGKAYWSIGEYEKAKDAFQKGIRIFPEDSSAYLGLIDMLLERVNKKLEEDELAKGKNLLDQAFLYYEQAKTLNPGSWPELSSRLSENYHWIAKKGVGNEKEQTVKRGTVHQGSIRVSNAGKEPVTVKVNQTDYLFYADGTNKEPPPGSVARSNAPWIEWDLGDSRLTVPAKSKVAVGYTLRVPDDPKLEGTYWSMVHITPVAGEAKQVKQGVTVRHSLGYGIPIVTQIGNTGSRKIKVMDAKAVEGKEKGESFFQVDIKNTGQRSLRPVVYLEVYDKQGKLIDKLKSPRGRVGIYPGCSVRHWISLSQLDPGKYPAMLVIDNLDQHVWGAKVNIKVSK